MIAEKYLPEIAWRTLIRNVIRLEEANYRVSVSPIDYNEPGAATREIGNYLKDFVGHTYRIIASDETTIDVVDDFNTGVGPQSGQYGIVFKSVKKGNAPYLAPIYYRHLDKSAIDYSRRIETDILWKPDPAKIEFEDTNNPKIVDYQDYYAEEFGELPDVRLVTYDSEGVEWVRQEVPVIYKTDGLIDRIEFDLNDTYSGYMILSL
jgi:hypothetical protein